MWVEVSRKGQKTEQMDMGSTTLRLELLDNYSFEKFGCATVTLVFLVNGAG
jgi:hypothetical protein